MTAPRALPAATRGYLDELNRHLGDLSPADRAELTAPIEQRLADLVPAGADVEQLYGSPAQLADDLRTAAGHPARPAAAADTDLSVGSWLRAGLANPGAVAVASYLRSLRPAWWAVRGYLLFGGFLAAADSTGYRMHTVGYYRSALVAEGYGHWSLAWGLLPAAATVASIVLGVHTRRLPPAPRLLVWALDAAAVVVLALYPTWWMAPAFGFFAGFVN